MKTTNKHFKPQTLSMQEMRVVEGGWVQYVIGGLILAGVGIALYQEYNDAKNEVITGEYHCPCDDDI